MKTHVTTTSFAQVSEAIAAGADRVTVVLDTPDQIETAQLIALKGAVKLESLGMRHSTGKSMRKRAAIKLGLSTHASIDIVIGALNREIERRIKLHQQEKTNGQA